jgi:hypothetical protein
MRLAQRDAIYDAFKNTEQELKELDQKRYRRKRVAAATPIDFGNSIVVSPASV